MGLVRGSGLSHTGNSMMMLQPGDDASWIVRSNCRMAPKNPLNNWLPVCSSESTTQPLRMHITHVLVPRYGWKNSDVHPKGSLFGILQEHLTKGGIASCIISGNSVNQAEVKKLGAVCEALLFHPPSACLACSELRLTVQPVSESWNRWLRDSKGKQGQLSEEVGNIYCRWQ